MAVLDWQTIGAFQRNFSRLQGLGPGCRLLLGMMSHRIRYVPPGGSLCEVTHRCLQGRHLLKPSPRLNRLVTGILARAQRLTGAGVVGATVLSNHLHLLLRVDDARVLARFMNYVSSNLAREASLLYDWHGKFWSGTYRAVLVADDEASQVARLRYLIANACKENLVARPEEWPGLHIATMIEDGPVLVGRWVDRTALCRARRRLGGASLEASDFEIDEMLELSPLPVWRQLNGRAYRARVQELRRDVAEETLARHSREGTRPLGRRKVLHQNPHRASPPPTKRPLPLLHTVSRAVRSAFTNAYRRIVKAFRAASIRLREGDRDVEFPPGTFPPGLAFVPHE